MKRIYILGVIFSVIFTSCADFLEKLPSTSLPVEEAITSIDDLENAVNGIYYLLSENRMTYGSDFAIYADLKGADFKALSNNNHAGVLSRYIITQRDALPDEAYYRFYRAIANVNKALSIADQLTIAEADQAKFSDLKGQLYAWRALLHFDLARIFCNAPTASSDINAANSGLVLSTEVYEPGYLAPRTTLKETYDQIIKDFDTSLTFLGNAVNNGRINYWSALALRARAYLYLGDNNKALADAQEVLSSTAYQLYTIDNYTKVWVQEYTSESLFELTITTNYNAQRNAVGYYCASEGYGECAFEVTSDLYKYLIANPNDVRSKLIDEQGGTNPGIYPAKYPGREGSLYVNSPKIIRLSEVYLIAAEATVKTGGNAASYINTLRKNRITDYTDVQSVTLDDILFERRVELFAENSMAFDYWRNKKSVINPNIGEVTYTDHQVIFPIPQAEIDLAPDILVQNPGY